jgi:hypothetical protein
MPNPQSSEGSATQTGAQPTGQAQQPNGKSRRWIVYAVLGIVVVIILAVLFLPAGSSLPKVSQVKSANSTEIYMSNQDAEALVGSALANYTVMDLYNSSAPINISYLSYLDPPLATNASSGWLTIALGSNSLANASLEYLVVTTANAESASKVLGSNLTEAIGGTPVLIAPGYANGLNYTYGRYLNGTNTTQVVYGWKGGNAVILIVQGGAGFSANESQMVSDASSAPYQ